MVLDLKTLISLPKYNLAEKKVSSSHFPGYHNFIELAAAPIKTHATI